MAEKKMQKEGDRRQEKESWTHESGGRKKEAGVRRQEFRNFKFRMKEAGGRLPGTGGRRYKSGVRRNEEGSRSQAASDSTGHFGQAGVGNTLNH